MAAVGNAQRFNGSCPSRMVRRGAIASSSRSTRRRAAVWEPGATFKKIVHQEIRREQRPKPHTLALRFKLVQRREAARVGAHVKETLAVLDPSGKRRRGDTVHDIGRLIRRITGEITGGKAGGYAKLCTCIREHKLGGQATRVRSRPDLLRDFNL